jgi:formylglycine-generating enzyme required for sulfatase activity
MLNKNFWMVRTAERGYPFEDFREKSLISIGWGRVGVTMRFYIFVLTAISIWANALAAEPNNQQVLLAQANFQEHTAQKMVEIANSKRDRSSDPDYIAAKEGVVNTLLSFVVFCFLYLGYTYITNRPTGFGNGAISTRHKTPKHEMIKIPGGTFEMGTDIFRNTKPVRQVTVRAFMLSNIVVTQEQWSSLMNGDNPSSNQEGGDHPVNCVSWHEAQAYITKLNEKTGKQYRLPTEAEWEYAARAGSGGRWCFGDEESQLGDFAWYQANYHYIRRKVGQKKPNSFALYDMHGLIQEWVQDVWHSNYKDAPHDGTARTAGNQTKRVIRGGPPSGDAKSLCSASRNHASAEMKASDIGFRIAHSC